MVGEIWSDYNNVRLRITSLSLPRLYDESDSAFDIRAK
jgi:hypothetical protein